MTPMALARSRWVFWAVLPALLAAEIVTTFVSAPIGLALHGLVALALVGQRALAHSRAAQGLALALLLAPLTRIVSLGLPLARFEPVARYAIASAPLLVGAAIVTQQLRLSGRDLGLRGADLGLQLLVSLGGLGLGAIAYMLAPPAPLAAGWSLGSLWVPALIFLVCTGLAEEMIFRGVLQSAALPALGPIALLYVAILFAALQIGFMSIAHVCFTCGVGLLLGGVRHFSRSIVGVSLAHGLTNVTMYLLMPYLAGAPESALATAAPWLVIGGTALSIGASALLIRGVGRPARGRRARAGQVIDLRALRLQSGYSYVDLARRSGIPVRQLAEAEHGLRQLQPSEQRLLAEALGFTQPLETISGRQGV